MPETVQKASRGASPVLLVLAALCFLLPFVGVSCNANGGSALGSAISNIGGPGSSNASACLQAFSGKDLATYSGANLLTGGNPSTATSIPGCDTSSSSSSSSTNQGGIGVQPLIVVAFILILVGIAAAFLRAPLRGWVAGLAALLAAVLIVINNATVHTAIINKITASDSSSSSLSSLGISGGADQFFNVHAAIGYYLALIALVLALVVSVAAAAMASGMRLTTAGSGAGTTAPDGQPPPPPPPGTEPPPQPPGG